MRKCSKGRGHFLYKRGCTVKDYILSLEQSANYKFCTCYVKLKVLLKIFFSKMLTLGCMATVKNTNFDFAIISLSWPDKNNHPSLMLTNFIQNNSNSKIRMYYLLFKSFLKTFLFKIKILQPLLQKKVNSAFWSFFQCKFGTQNS